MKQKGETQFEYLTRIVQNLEMEPGWIVDSLETTEAIIDYFELWDKYDTDFMEGIEEAIMLNGADRKPLEEFIAKHGLAWNISAVKPPK